MLIEKPLYSLNDITIIPAVSTDIKSRSECNPFKKGIEGQEDFYPLIAAPMDSVVTTNNWIEYHDNGISCVIPRTVPLEVRLGFMSNCFTSFSLDEARQMMTAERRTFPDKPFILLDIANGTMQEEIEIGKQLKEFFGDSLTLMGGNIGHPATYLLYDMAGFDFLRVGIGDGAGCLTSRQLGVSYPYASLISEISNLKYRYHSHCKIIADGGMENYSDINKCLALGADYVMCGMLLAKAVKHSDMEQIGDKFIYRGMSTKSAQKDMGNSQLKTAEGRTLELQKEYTLEGWTENFDSYLRSAMSYCDSRSLKEFREKAVCQVMSPNASYKINNK
jgi:IMP dehydrogenase/GMP reductase